MIKMHRASVAPRNIINTMALRNHDPAAGFGRKDSVRRGYNSRSKMLKSGREKQNQRRKTLNIV